MRINSFVIEPSIRKKPTHNQKKPSDSILTYALTPGQTSVCLHFTEEYYAERAKVGAAEFLGKSKKIGAHRITLPLHTVDLPLFCLSFLPLFCLSFLPLNTFYL